MFLSSGLKNGFTPTSLSGCQQWLDYTDVGSLTLSGTAITNIADKSGHGRDLPQSTGSYQPSLGGSLSSILRCGVFDNDHMGPSASADMDLTSGYTLFIVGSVSNKKSFNGWYRVAAALVTSPSHVEIYEGTGALLIITNRGVTTDNRYIRNRFASNGDNHIYTYQPHGTNPADMEILVNDIDRTYTSGGANMYPSSAGYVWAGIGYGNITTGNLRGTISEIIVYDRELENWEVAFVQRYLSKKHNISIENEPEQYADLKIWLDASDEGTYVLSGSSVTSWSDKSENNYTFTQGTASLQPTLVSGDKNGLNTILFDGADYLDSGTTTSYIPFMRDGSDYCIGVGYKVTADAALNSFFGSAQSTSQTGGFFAFEDRVGQGTNAIRVEGYKGTVGTGSYSCTSDNSAVFNDYTYNLLIVDYGTDCEFYSEGTLVDTITPSFNGTSASATDTYPMAIGRLGTTGNITGNILEIFIIENLPDAGEITKLNEYLSNKWGI